MAMRKKVMRSTPRPDGDGGRYTVGSKSSHLVQTKVHFRKSLLQDLDKLVRDVQGEDSQYSRSIFIEKAVERELARLRGKLPAEGDRHRSW